MFRATSIDEIPFKVRIDEFPSEDLACVYLKDLMRKTLKKEIESSSNKAFSKMCEYTYFVRVGKILVLCGPVHFYKNSFRFAENMSRVDYICNYLLCDKSGFYIIQNLSGEYNDLSEDAPYLFSPSILLSIKNNIVYATQNKVYDISSIASVYTIAEKLSGTKLIDGSIIAKPVYEIEVTKSGDIIRQIANINTCQVACFEPGRLVFEYLNSEETYNPKYVLDAITGECYPLLWHITGFNQKTSKSLLYAYTLKNSQKNLLSDENNIYFYIYKDGEISAYDTVIRLLKDVDGVSVLPMQNLFPQDSTVNVCIKVPKKYHDLVHTILFSKIYRNRNTYALRVLGVPLWAIMELLEWEEKYECKSVDLARITAAVVEELTYYFKAQSYADLIKIITDYYGPYILHNDLSCYASAVEMTDAERNAIWMLGGNRIERKELPAIWKSEFRLFLLVKEYYPSAIMHYSPAWLGGQHLDIYIPEEQIALEYQGQQHYAPVDIFGGDEGFKYRQHLDEQKKTLCFQNNVSLIEWRYDTPILPVFLIKAFRKIGKPIAIVPDINRESVWENGLLYRLKEIEKAEQKQNKENKISSYVIRQYRTDGKLIGEYASYDDAEIKTGISKRNLQRVCCGEKKTTGGYLWRKVELGTPAEDIEPIKTEKNRGIARKILQVNSDGVVIKEFDSVSLAAKEIGINTKSIIDAAHGRQKTAGGFHWVYGEE